MESPPVFLVLNAIYITLGFVKERSRRRETLLYYFAYGSNLHPVRLLERVTSATLFGVVELYKHRLEFHKKGQDGSSKCNAVRTEGEFDRVYGALYQVEHDHKNDLDRIEGVGSGYRDQQIKLHYQGQEYTCFTYFAQSPSIGNNLKPYHWYKQLVVLGAKHLQFPDAYVQSIEQVESVEDPDETRRTTHELLIGRILNYSHI